MSYSLEEWARAADEYQRIANRRRAEERAERRVAPLEWLVIVIFACGVIAALVLGTGR
jgi:hypothetical protein